MRQKSSPSKRTSKKVKFSSTEAKILRLLYKVGAPLSAYGVAKELNISFQTAKKYLEKMLKERYVVEGEM